MENDLQKTVIFKGMTDEEISDALSLLCAKEKRYKKGAAIFHAGDSIQCMGLVLEGSVTIESNDMWGNRTILSHVSVRECFAETYALLEDEPLLVDVVANESCRILFFRIGSLLLADQQMRSWTAKLTANLLLISTHKNLALSGRSFHTCAKTIRGRVMAFLNSISLQKHSREFEIPFDRQQLADYLNVERSALSKELGNMQRDGLIWTKKNNFRIT